MEAEIVSRALGGRKAGASWMARCPAHDDRTPSLSICDAHDGRVLVHCHSGCEQARVIEALRSLGLWAETRQRKAILPAPQGIKNGLPDRNGSKRTLAALAIWNSAIRADGTLVETYLTSRGIHVPVPSALRFHSELKHPSGGIWPCMVALVTRGADDMPLAIHRTFLARDGSGKAPVDPSKMMLGPCRGGAVRLGEPREVLMIGEGIETCLTAMRATGNTAWSALSTSGLRALDPPETVRKVIVLADGDDSGEAAARDCAFRWMQQGRRVRIARPPRGIDFNDMLLGKAFGIRGRAT